METVINCAPVAKKPSFKTTSLIAAIGMTIAVGYYLITQFIWYFTGVDIYAHPVRMQGLWRIYDCLWWTGILVFFWGMFRYPDQLPTRGKQSKIIYGALLGALIFLAYDRIYIFSFTDVLVLKIIRYTLRAAAHGIYLSTMWWCYAKSAKQPTHLAMRYTSLSIAIFAGVVLMLLVNSGLGWWFGKEVPFSRGWETYSLYLILYALIAFGLLITKYVRPTVQLSPDKTKRRLQHLHIIGWVLVSAFMLIIISLVCLIKYSDAPEWAVEIFLLFLFAIPLISGIYLLVACRYIREMGKIE